MKRKLLYICTLLSVFFYSCAENRPASEPIPEGMPYDTEVSVNEQCVELIFEPIDYPSPVHIGNVQLTLSNIYNAEEDNSPSINAQEVQSKLYSAALKLENIVEEKHIRLWVLREHLDSFAIVANKKLFGIEAGGLLNDKFLVTSAYNTFPVFVDGTIDSSKYIRRTMGQAPTETPYLVGEILNGGYMLPNQITLQLATAPTEQYDDITFTVTEYLEGGKQLTASKTFELIR